MAPGGGGTSECLCKDVVLDPATLSQHQTLFGWIVLAKTRQNSQISPRVAIFQNY